MTVSEEGRQALILYQRRTGLTNAVIADRMGYARQTLVQFRSNSSYGADGVRHDGTIARAVLEFIKANPPEGPEKPGKLYSTQNVVIIRELVSLAREGAWVLIYGPPGTQKSFVFEYLTAEAWGEAEGPGLAYVYASANMGRRPFVAEVARAIGAFASGHAHGILGGILHALRGRRNRPALIVDEAHHLGGNLPTLELLREIGDRGKVGLVVAGHDNLEEIFQSKKAGPLEQWFSRIDYHRRLPGLSAEEVKRIARAELGEISEAVADSIVKNSRVEDYREGKPYLSARRLFKVLAQTKA